MEARYAFRKSQLLEECQVAPEIFEQVIPRLYTIDCTGRSTSQSGQRVSVLANDAGIRWEFSINDHLHGFLLAVRSSEDNMVGWRKPSRFYASTPFWTEGSIRKRKPISPVSP